MSRGRQYLRPDHYERLNPQFIGITERYATTRRLRNLVESERNSMEKKLTFYQRTKQTLDDALVRKKQQLSWLKSVRERHLSDIKEKKQQQEHNNFNLEMLRFKSEQARNCSRKNIHNAVIKTKLQKLRATEEVKSTLEDIKRLKSNRESEKSMLFTIRSKQLEEQRSIKRSRINKFFQKKNKKLLNEYKQKISTEELHVQKSQKQMQSMSEAEQKIGKVLDRKKSKLEKLQQQIRRLKMQAAQPAFLHGLSVDFSRISKNSSKPTDIILRSTLLN